MARGLGSRGPPRGRRAGRCRPGRTARDSGGSGHGLGGRRRYDPDHLAGCARETVRILGIDAPEVRHKNDPIPEDQPHGPESLAFARSRILGASRLELVRASHRDRFGRTLGYLFVDGVNYSVLAIENHMAESTIDRFGDSGFPREAAEVARPRTGRGRRRSNPPCGSGIGWAMPQEPPRSRRMPLLPAGTGACSPFARHPSLIRISAPDVIGLVLGTLDSSRSMPSGP